MQEFMHTPQGDQVLVEGNKVHFCGNPNRIINALKADLNDSTLPESVRHNIQMILNAVEKFNPKKNKIIMKVTLLYDGEKMKYVLMDKDGWFMPLLVAAKEAMKELGLNCVTNEDIVAWAERHPAVCQIWAQ